MSTSLEELTAIALTVNGASHTTTARTLAEWLDQQGHNPQAVATALNSQFVPRTRRAAQVLNAGDAIVTFQAIEGG